VFGSHETKVANIASPRGDLAWANMSLKTSCRERNRKRAKKAEPIIIAKITLPKANEGIEIPISIAKLFAYKSFRARDLSMLES